MAVGANNISIDELRERVQAGECSDPIVILESISRGQDPRIPSGIYQLVNDINEFSDGQPSASDWEELVKLVYYRYKHEVVSVSDSMAAARTLAEYLHAKKKQVDINKNNNNISSSATPLTEEDVELFRERFNDEF